MKIYHNPRCSKSRQALSLIQEKGINVDIIEYLKEIPSSQELKNVIEKLGIKPEELLRKGESIYKSDFKGKTLTDDQWIEAMIMYPKLIERPIIINGEKAVIGRPAEKVLEII